MVSSSYVWGLVFLRLVVSFLTFGGYFSYVLVVSNSYVLVVSNSYVWGLVFLRFGG